jgi:hypothetical protein
MGINNQPDQPYQLYQHIFYRMANRPSAATFICYYAVK